MAHITQSLIVLFILISAIHASVTPSSLSKYKLRTYGPAPISPVGLALVKQIIKLPNNMTYPKPVPTSAPVITIGLTHSITGDNAATDGVGIMDIIQFYVDVSNMYGGVWVNNTQYQLSVIAGDDESSSSLMLLMYEEMLQGQGLQLLLGPFGDAMQMKLAPMLINQSVSLVTSTSLDPATFQSIKQSIKQSNSSINMYQIAPPANYWHTIALNEINMLAKNHSMSPSEDVYSTIGTAFGINTACLFTSDDEFTMNMYEGVVQWIDQENKDRRARGASSDQLINIVVNEVFNSTYLVDYETYWLMCPDGSSLVVMPLNMASNIALERSGRAFAAVLALNNGDEFVISSFSNGGELKHAAGWHLSLHFLDRSNAQSMKGQPLLLLDPLVMQYEVYRQVSPTMPSIFDLTAYALARCAELSYLLTAVNASSGFSVDLVRQGMFSLSGGLGLLGPIDFDTSSGVNDARQQGLGSTRQINRQGQLVADREYPYQWEWLALRVGPGTPINHEIDAMKSIIGVVCVVVSVWVGSILIDQAVWVRQKKGSRSWEFILWWSFSCEAIGGLGIFGANLMWATGVNPLWPDSQNDGINQDSEWSFGALCVGWLIPINCVALAISLYTMNWSGSLIGSKLTEPDQEAKQTWTWLKELAFLCRCVLTFRGLLSGVLLVASVQGGRMFVLESWIVDMSYHIPIWSFFVNAVILLVCLPISLAAFRFGVKWRVSAVLLFSLGITLDWAITAQSISFSYDPNPSKWFNSSLMQSIVLSPLVVTLIAGVGTAGITLLFVGIQFVRMRLSHREVLNTVRAQEKALDAATAKIDAMVSMLSKERARITALRQAVDCVTLMTALPHQWALPFAIFNIPDESGCSHSRNTSHQSGLSKTKSNNASLGASAELSKNIIAVSALSKSKIKTRKVVPMLQSSSTLARIPINIGNDESLVVLSSTSEESILSCLAAQDNVAPVDNELAFSLTAPLLDKGSTDHGFPLGVLSLKQIMSHPCCLELFKQEMLRFHCVENLTFWLHARKYRTINQPKLRSAHARNLIATYIAEGSPQQINLSTQQRKSICDTFASHSSPGAQTSNPLSRLLFHEAERECMLLMQTNQWDRFTKTVNYRLSCWIYSLIDYRVLGQSWLTLDSRGEFSSMRNASLNGESVKSTE